MSQPTVVHWISVDEQLPPMREPYKDGPKTSGMILIFTGHYVSIGEYEETYAKRKPRWVGRFGNIKVTHWASLPEGPQ